MRHTVIVLLAAVAASILRAQTPRAEEYERLTDDGAWCWFSDPRAVYQPGKETQLYTGWASAKGDIVVARYDHATGEVLTHTLVPEFQKDDHVNPSLLVLPDGRLMVFFSMHNGPLYVATSKRAGDITEFEPARRIGTGEKECYSNPVMLADENNRIYLFFRGGSNSKPTFVTSDDLGRTWSAPRVLLARPGASFLVRPYMKVVSDGTSRIHFAFTDGHPRDEPMNSVYYMTYHDGVFSDAAGNALGRMSDLPIDQSRIPRVYDGETERVRAWVWDIAIGEDGRPAVVYATLPQESRHEYKYALWDGRRWTNRHLCEAGSWFPRFEKTKEQGEPEPHYSGGICLDHSNPTVVYLSRPHGDTFEIERWETSDGGEKWTHRMLTERSDRDNVRPVSVADRPAGASPSVLWMNIRRYRHYTEYQAAIVTDRPAQGFVSALMKSEVSRVMTAVAEWQMDRARTPRHHELDWTSGALYRGIFEWARLTHHQAGMEWLQDIGARYGWQPYFRMYHADDICVSQTFLDLYRLKNDRRMIDPTQARIDWVIAHPSTASMMLDYRDPSTSDRWSWCDALFMAPPVYAKLAAITGDEKYLEFMHREYVSTYDLLYDREEHLFYRDHKYINTREANGAKVFWGRGNGWVMGGLVSLLEELPERSPYRDFYVTLFKEMASAVASAQSTNGYWHASMLDPASYPNPETSCTGFFCYALAYGINTGLLEKDRYLPHVRRGWKALVNAVSPDGRLGWVQPIGEDPRKTDRSMTEVYGVGAFLLAGSQVMALAE